MSCPTLLSTVLCLSSSVSASSLAMLRLVPPCLFPPPPYFCSMVIWAPCLLAMLSWRSLLTLPVFPPLLYDKDESVVRVSLKFPRINQICAIMYWVQSSINGSCKIFERIPMVFKTGSQWPWTGLQKKWIAQRCDAYFWRPNNMTIPKSVFWKKIQF